MRATRLAGLLSLALLAQPLHYDLVLINGRVLDGTGARAVRGDVAIRDGRIAAVGRVSRVDAAAVLDVSGLVVAPGFIDVHAHADGIARHPDAANFVRMGVTTVVAGNCGESALDVSAALSAIRDARPAINYATLIGHETVRRAVMGTADRFSGAADLARMKSLVWKGMADGAIGFSTGPEYVSGTTSRLPEIIELVRVVANAGGIYTSHLRGDGRAPAGAAMETIRVGEVTGARLEISHVKGDNPGGQDASDAVLRLIAAARGRGVDVEADQYAYTDIPSLRAEAELQRIMRDPNVSFASDADVMSVGRAVPHPRSYGNTARVLGIYVREKQILSLEQAVRKMTSLPAEHFRLPDRGVITPGAAADLVVFDPARIADTATYERPQQYPTGIPYVLVNGVVVVRQGVQADARPGQVIAKSLLEPPRQLINRPR